MDEDEGGQAFVAIYYGKTVSSAKLIGVTMDPETIACAAHRILQESQAGGRRNRVTALQEAGRQAALRMILEEVEGK